MLEWIALIALGFGAFAGARALFQPDWIAAALKLQADPARPGGYAEFRATFGGLFLAIHLVAIIIMWMSGPITSALIAATVSAGWLGAAFGRIASLALDGEKLGQGGINRIWIGLEIIIGTALIAPLLRLAF